MALHSIAARASAAPPRPHHRPPTGESAVAQCRTDTPARVVFHVPAVASAEGTSIVLLAWPHSGESQRVRHELQTTVPLAASAFLQLFGAHAAWDTLAQLQRHVSATRNTARMPAPDAQRQASTDNPQPCRGVSAPQPVPKPTSLATAQQDNSDAASAAVVPHPELGEGYLDSERPLAWDQYVFVLQQNTRSLLIMPEQGAASTQRVQSARQGEQGGSDGRAQDRLLGVDRSAAHEGSTAALNAQAATDADGNFMGAWSQYMAELTHALRSNQRCDASRAASRSRTSVLCEDASLLQRRTEAAGQRCVVLEVTDAVSGAVCTLEVLLDARCGPPVRVPVAPDALHSAVRASAVARDIRRAGQPCTDTGRAAADGSTTVCSSHASSLGTLQATKRRVSSARSVQLMAQLQSSSRLRTTGRNEPLGSHALCEAIGSQPASVDASEGAHAEPHRSPHGHDDSYAGVLEVAGGGTADRSAQALGDGTFAAILWSSAQPLLDNMPVPPAQETGGKSVARVRSGPRHTYSAQPTHAAGACAAPQPHARQRAMTPDRSRTLGRLGTPAGRRRSSRASVAHAMSIAPLPSARSTAPQRTPGSAAPSQQSEQQHEAPPESEADSTTPSLPDLNDEFDIPEHMLGWIEKRRWLHREMHEYAMQQRKASRRWSRHGQNFLDFRPPGT